MTCRVKVVPPSNETPSKSPATASVRVDMTTMFCGFVGLIAIASSASFPGRTLVSTLVGTAANAGRPIRTSRARLTATTARARIRTTVGSPCRFCNGFPPNLQRRRLDPELGLDRHPGAQRVQHHAVLLGAPQETLRALAAFVAPHDHVGPRADRCQTDGELAAHGEGPARVPVPLHRDLERLQLDAHVRRDHAQGGLLAGRERRE